MILDFNAPLTWSDIINIAMTAVAIVTCVAAIIANCKSTKAMKLSLKMQEQAKNVDLFDKRMLMLKKIESNEKINMTEFSLLFGTNFNAKYQKWESAVLKTNNINCDISEYKDYMNEDFESCQHMDEMERLKNNIIFNDDSIKDNIDFKELCDRYAIVRYNAFNDLQEYNYYNLECNLDIYEQKQHEYKKELINAMTAFIEDSIKSLEKRSKK